MVWNLVFFVFNVVFFVIFYNIIKNRLESKYINKEIIERIKKEINGLILDLNETTLRNVSVVEGKINKLKELIKESDIKCSRLEERLKNSEKKEIKMSTSQNFSSSTSSNSLQSSNVSSFGSMTTTSMETGYNTEEPVTYNPMDISRRNKIIEEKKILENLKNYEREKEELNYFNSLTTVEKIEYLLNKGFTPDEVRKKLSIDQGEFEFLMNIERINYNKN